MYKIKKGDVVGRISYGKDILFTVENIIKGKDGKKVAILKGIILRIEADADIEDLSLIDKKEIANNVRGLDTKIQDKIRKCCNKKNKNNKKRFLLRSIDEENGRIVHLDGDKRYSEKSLRYYKKIGLNAIVRNVPENKQEYVVMDILNKYNPDTW